jgi:hypothetical protein
MPKGLKTDYSMAKFIMKSLKIETINVTDFKQELETQKIKFDIYSCSGDDKP